MIKIDFESWKLFRSCRPKVFCKKGVLRNFTTFTGKHLCRASFLIKLQAWACNFIKKETLAQVFSCGFCEIPKNSFSYIIEILADICYSVKLLKATIKQLWVPKILDIQATLRARTWPVGRDLWGIGRGLWKNEYIWINPSSLSCIVEKWPNTF